MGALLRDLRFAARMLAKSPGYTAVAVLTLALGIGANTAIFSTVHAVLLRPLPYEDPEKLMFLWETTPDFPEMSVSYANFADYDRDQKAFTDLAMFRADSFNLTGAGGEPERLAVRMVSPELMPLIGVKPMLGRNFTAEENVTGGPRTAILSYGLWQRRFGGDPEILGKPITLSGDVHTVIGVMAEDFRFFRPKDLFVPIGLYSNQAGFQSRGNHPGIYMIGRLKPGVTPAQANADLTRVGAGIAAQFPKDYGKNTHPAAKPLREALVDDLRGHLLLLFGAVAFVLLIAAANVANLMLARALTRSREMAIRASLGSGRLRLIRQLLVESALLSLLGAGLGLVLALWGVDFLASMRPQAIETLGPIAIDGTVLAYTVGIALATGLLFGLVPAVIASKQDLSQVLKEGDHRATAGAGRLRVRNLLVVGEVALALVLLVGAGLAIRGFSRLEGIDPGFVPENLLTMKLSLPPKYDTADKILAFYRELERRIEALPGVESAATSAGIPFAGASETSFRINDEQTAIDNARFAVYYPVSTGYLEALKTRLLAGRTFNAEDTRTSRKVAIVDRKIAELFPGGAVGQRIRFDSDEVPPFEIIGVVEHVAHYGLEGKQPAPYQMYMLYEQIDDKLIASYFRDVDVIVRTQGPPLGLAKAVRAQVSAMDAEQPIYEQTTLEKLIHDSIAERRFTMALLGVFAALALLLAAVGLYAVMSHSVTQRTHEIGVRMALGAQPGEVVSMVLRHGLRLVLVGLVVGLGGALAVTRLLQSQLSGVSPTDPGTFAGVLLVLVAVGLLATYIPARRATRVDPMIALRNE
jgi:putative ABC transport system permease protein